MSRMRLLPTCTDHVTHDPKTLSRRVDMQPPPAKGATAHHHNRLPGGTQAGGTLVSRTRAS